MDDRIHFILALFSVFPHDHLADQERFRQAKLAIMPIMHGEIIGGADWGNET